jgi:hypothetical protein
MDKAMMKIHAKPKPPKPPKPLADIPVEKS